MAAASRAAPLAAARGQRQLQVLQPPPPPPQQQRDRKEHQQAVQQRRQHQERAASGSGWRELRHWLPQPKGQQSSQPLQGRTSQQRQRRQGSK